MKVGDYVRTINGISKIIKIQDIITSDNEYMTTLITHDNGNCDISNILKSSPNIIDLIEPMDLLYIDIEYGFAGGLVVPRIYETQAELDEAIKKIKNDEERELVGIVTHEQLENMMYEVKNERTI